MTTFKTPTKQPALIKGLSWSIFAATATFGAFVLPAFILYTITDTPHFDEKSWIVPIISLILITSTYFGLYRFSVFINDIGKKKTAQILKIIFTITFSISFLVLIFLNFQT